MYQIIDLGTLKVFTASVRISFVFFSFFSNAGPLASSVWNRELGNSRPHMTWSGVGASRVQKLL